MTARFNPYEKHFNLVKPLIDLGNTVQTYGLEKTIIHLVKIRASQINGCARLPATCTPATPARMARRRSASICSTPGARSPLFTRREQAALAWTEALTRLAETRRAGRGL